MYRIGERQRDVAMVEIFNQGVPHLARTTWNLRTGFALIVVAMFLGLTVCAKLGMGAPSGVPPDASSRVLAAAGSPEQEGAAKAFPEQEEHGLSPKAEEVTRIFGFPITNSMIVSWVVALGVIIFAQAATRHMKQVPEGAQNLLEWLVEGLHRFLEGIIGEHLTKRTFWFFATVFIFILCTNWVGLIPGIGSVGWGHQTAHGFRIEQSWLRGANADVNMTFAMALVFFACWIVWALQEVGPLGFLKELFAPKGQTTGLLRLLMVFVFFAAGCLEIVSILFRPISLSFRLYGNIFAGENMMEAMSRLVPGFGWLVPIPFYFLELLMGLVQALVFMLLTAVFTLLICQHEEGPVPAHG
jgi:F-type H+-transporting ATPase subunit a